LFVKWNEVVSHVGFGSRDGSISQRMDFANIVIHRLASMHDAWALQTPTVSFSQCRRYRIS
jgi:hypothetical protein